MEGTRDTKKRSSLGIYQAEMNYTNMLSNFNNKEAPNTSFMRSEENDSVSTKTRKVKSFKTWSFGTVNIRSGKEKEDGAKIYAIAKEVNRAGLSFCCMQEVRYRNTGNKLIQLDTGEAFEFHWCGKVRKREAGVGILIKVHPDVEISTPDINDPRVMAINVKIHGFNIRIVNGYSPTNSDGSESEKDLFYQKLKKACVKDQKHQKLMVVGDFNAATSIAKYHSCYDGEKIITDPECNENGIRLKSFCKSQKLCMSSTFFDHPMLCRYTWYSNDKKTRKINDYILVEKYIQQYITDCLVELDYEFDSDHRLLQGTICAPCTRQARRKAKVLPRNPRPDIKALQDPDTRKKYVDVISRGLCDTDHHDCSTKTSEKIIDVIATATQILPRKSKRGKERELWRNDEILNSLLNQRTNHDMQSPQYKKVSKAIKKRVTWLRNEKLRSEAEEINEYANTREIEELFRSIKADGSTFKNTRHKSGCDPAQLKQHFINHFNQVIEIDDPIELREIPVFIKKLQEIKSDDIKTNPPDHNELRAILKKLKNGKGANDITAEHLKYAESSNELIEEMIHLYNTVWHTHTIPKFWGHSRLVSLWKGSVKGSKKDPKAYRALQICSTFCKIMIIVIINRIKSWYDRQLLDQQQGFRSGRGTADGIFITKRIQQITDKMKKPVYILFIDLTAAFDHVVRKWMFKSIYQRFPAGTDRTLIELLEALYAYTTTALAETPDDLFELALGVRQGGPESPPLYNLFMDYVMRIYTNLCEQEDIRFLKLRYRIPSTATTREERYNKTDHGEHTTDWVGYADDLELIFEDADNLQKGLEILDNTFKRYHLTINVSKTKTMILNYKYINEDLSTYPITISNLYNVSIENVKTFRYLGDEIKYDEPSTGDAEVGLRIDVAEKKFYELAKKLLNYKILLKTRVKILNTMVRSRLTYLCQTWNLTCRQTERINSTYTTMLRKMVKGGYRRKRDMEWNFILNNSDLHEICGTEDISYYTARQQRKYLAHLARQPNKSLTKRLLFNSNEASKTGRRSTLETRVLTNEQCTPNTFYKKALKRQY